MLTVDFKLIKWQKNDGTASNFSTTVIRRSCWRGNTYMGQERLAVVSSNFSFPRLARVEATRSTVRKIQ